MSATSGQLQNVIDNYLGGSEGRTRHPFNRRFIYTEGVKAVADSAGAYWLLDIVATEVAPIALRLWDEVGDGQTFLHVTVYDDQSCGLKLDDGNGMYGTVHWQRALEYTNFPVGKWVFYLFMDGILEAPREVLVMLLPSEN